MDSNIKISIVLPAYNAEKTISKSIESVLIQTLSNFELIIINDGSIDKTESIINSFLDSRIVYIKNEKNVGLIETLNKGILNSRGKYIARIDADDLWIDKDKLKKQVEFLQNNPEHVLVGTQAIIKSEKDNTKTNYPLEDKKIRSKILSKNLFIHSSIMIKREYLDNNPYLMEDYLVEDYSLWLRLGLNGKFANLPDCCVEYLINPVGETQTKNFIQTFNSFNLIKKYKGKYPQYYKSFIIWSIKIILRKFIFSNK